MQKLPMSPVLGQKLADGGSSIPAKGGDIALPLMPHESASASSVPPALVRQQTAFSIRSVTASNRCMPCCSDLWRSIRQLFEGAPETITFQPSTQQNFTDHLAKIGMTAQDYQQIKDVFNLLDTEGNGVIPKESFCEMILELGMTISEPEKEFAAIDADRNGLITLEDFVHWGQFQSGAGKSLSDIKRAFDAIDTNGRGYISVLDFCKLAASQNESYSSPSEMIKAFQELDRDRDGYISWKQFARVWNEVTFTQKMRQTRSRVALNEINWNQPSPTSSVEGKEFCART